jgi:nucleotide-binding universal stress UspA family protein
MKLSLHEILKAERELAASRPAPKTEWERILVPIDFSENSREALKLAVSLAADPEDRITLLHVVEPEHPFQRGNEVMMTLSKGEAEIRYEAERRLERWAAQEAGPDIEIATVVRFGKVTDEILALAETRDCDIIVLATEPAGWMKRLFSGSVTAQLQRRAKCAVINIRPATPVARPVIPVQFPTEKVVRFKQPARRAIPVR